MEKYIKFSVAAFSLFLLLSVIAYSGKDYLNNNEIKNYNQVLKDKLKKIDAAFLNIINDSTIVSAIIAQKMPSNYYQPLQNKSYSLLVYKDNKLFFWNKNNTTPSEQIAAEIPEGKSTVKFLNGLYYTQKKTIFINENGYSFLMVYLLKNEFFIQNKFLQNTLNEDLNLPNYFNISLTNFKYATPFYNDESSVIFYLGKDYFLFQNYPQAGIIALHVLAQLFFYLGWLSLVFYIKETKSFYWSFLFLIVGFVLFRAINIYFNFPVELTKLDLFSPLHFASSQINKSLGDLAIHVVLVWIVSYYWYRFAPDYLPFNSKKIKRFLMPFLFYNLLFFVSFSIGIMFKNLLIHSNIPFDLNNFLNINFFSFIGIVIIALLLFAFALFTFKTVLIFKISFENQSNFILFILAFSLHLLFIYFNQHHYVFYISAFWTLMFVYFVADFQNQQQQVFSFTSLMLLIIFFAVFSVVHLFKNLNSIDKERKISIAKNLAQSDDPITEYLFINVQNKIAKDLSLKNYFLRPFISKKDIIQNLKNNYFIGYLKKYEVKIYLINSDGNMLLSDDRDIMHFINTELLEQARETQTENLFFIPRKNGNYTYLSNITITENSKFIGTVVILLNPKIFYKSNLYPELLLEDYVKPGGKFGDYSFAEYAFKTLYNKSGSCSYPTKFSFADTLDQEFLKINDNEYDHLIYNAPNNKIIIVSSIQKSFIQTFTLFSYLFLFYLLLFLIFWLLRVLKNWIIGNYSFSDLTQISLKNKIQFSMISLIVVAFLFIGIVTIFHFVNQYDASHKDKLLDKEEAISTQISYALNENKNISNINTSTFFYEDKNDDVLRLNELSEIHGIDINLFDTTGRLMNTSQPDIFDKELFANFMNSSAYNNLKFESKLHDFETEHIGKLTFLSLYAPLKNKQGELLAYLHLPYFAKEKELKNELSSFLISLINVYVLLLVASAFIAYIISDSITQSLSILIDKFKLVKLGETNEPIIWKSNDEIGALVQRYNEMLQELEESAKLLAKSERESAWREMAKQIAHEIKNPLTPMKLNIQMLQKAMKEGKQNIMPLSEKVCNTLVEQIDNLADIASSFSSFAKIMQARPEKILLNDVLQSVTNLYPSDDLFQLNYNAPSEKIEIYADKNLLLRAFGNLIKNAQQAIPEHVSGILNIDVVIRNQHVLISFKDNGTGIPDEVHSKIFNPNFTTKNSGMGLGLAITKQAIEAGASGKIYFETKLNIGTTFFVELPCENHISIY